MIALRLALVVWAAQAMLLCGVCCAAPPTPPSEMPVAGPPPDTDFLPPVPDADRARAGTQMLWVVVGSLALIAVLLRLVGKRAADAGTGTARRANGDDGPFERARRVLEEMDKARK